MADRSDEASRLAQLVSEIDELEKSRIGLLVRLENLRAKLLAAGDRTMAMRASVDLLCDHITELATTVNEFSMFEREAQETQQGMDEIVAESSGLAFESESLHEALSETDEDLERLNSLLLERRGKHSRGH
ncbi:MAG TPA: hypothetical protein VLM38_14580 [Blastocatellia bacterium]|nr:hypothetical protein [Blastocatellia bacterium]